ncbi:MAG: protein mobE [Methylococcales bacterium]|nr:MAG: protein mobE [Methylococcales bacterium]
MSDLDDSFAKLLGREPTDTEKQNLLRIGDALGVKKNDAFWLILMALQSHQTLYSEIPVQIEVAAKSTLNNIKAAADIAMAASAGKATAALSKAVSDVAYQVASDTAKKEKIKWIAGCVAVTVLCISGLTWKVHSIAHESGYYYGYGLGYEKAVDEKAAAAWSNTAQGKAAYKLATTGELDSLLHCNRAGWSVENGVCYVNKTKDGLFGWKIP